MFVAGTESTASTLKWAILFLAGRPEFQDRLYSEIINSIGKDRMPSLEDRLQMPFLGNSVLTLSSDNGGARCYDRPNVSRQASKLILK